MPRDRAQLSLVQLAKLGRFDELRRLAGADGNIDLAQIFAAAVTDFRTVKRTPGHQQILSWCLDLGLDAGARAGWLHESIVCLAARNGNHEIVASIVARGLPDDPFARAAIGDVDFLARHAAGQVLAELRDTNGFNLLFACAGSGLGRHDESMSHRLAETCRLLLDQRVDPAHTVSFELPIFPAWLCAAYGGNAEVMRQLLDHGGMPPALWHQALEHTLEPHQRSGEPHFALAALILNHGFDVNQLSPQGRTLLHGAAHRGTVAAVRWLLANRANPNALDSAARTPLHLSAQRNTSAVVARLLIEAGADRTLRDAAQQSALDYAPPKPAHQGNRLSRRARRRVTAARITPAFGRRPWPTASARA